MPRDLILGMKSRDGVHLTQALRAEPGGKTRPVPRPATAITSARPFSTSTNVTRSNATSARRIPSRLAAFDQEFRYAPGFTALPILVAG